MLISKVSLPSFYTVLGYISYLRLNLYLFSASHTLTRKLNCQKLIECKTAWDRYFIVVVLPTSSLFRFCFLRYSFHSVLPFIFPSILSLFSLFSFRFYRFFLFLLPFILFFYHPFFFIFFSISPFFIFAVYLLISCSVSFILPLSPIYLFVQDKYGDKNKMNILVAALPENINACTSNCTLYE